MFVDVEVLQDARVVVADVTAELPGCCLVAGERAVAFVFEGLPCEVVQECGRGGWSSLVQRC